MPKRQKSKGYRDPKTGRFAVRPQRQTSNANRNKRPNSSRRNKPRQGSGRRVPYRSKHSRTSHRPHRTTGKRSVKSGQRIKRTQRPNKRNRLQQSARKTRKVSQSGLRLQEPVFNLCFAADREDFYQTTGADYDKALQSKRLTRGEKSRIRVEMDIGSPSDLRKRKGRKRRTTTAYIGKRRFSDFDRLHMFLQGANSPPRPGQKTPGEPFRWDKSHGCQFNKSAKLIVLPRRPGGKVKVLKRYKFEQPE